MKPSQKTNLKTLTPDQINKIDQDHRANGQWDLSDERQHMETLFCQRLNFLLIVYSLIVAGLVTTQDRRLFLGILFSGTIITILMGLSLWRACSKLLIILAICYRIDHHPMDLVDAEIKEHGFWFRGFRVNHVLGYWIPVVCAASLIVALICALIGVLGPHTQNLATSFDYSI